MKFKKKKIARLRFADDISFLGSNKNELENTENGINQILVDGINVKINKNKTTVLVFTMKKQKRQAGINIIGQNFEQVTEFHYLESKIT